MDVKIVVGIIGGIMAVLVGFILNSYRLKCNEIEHLMCKKVDKDICKVNTNNLTNTTRIDSKRLVKLEDKIEQLLVSNAKIEQHLENMEQGRS